MPRPRCTHCPHTATHRVVFDRHVLVWRRTPSAGRGAYCRLHADLEVTLRQQARRAQADKDAQQEAGELKADLKVE